jgi:hypothetical protein
VTEGTTRLLETPEPNAPFGQNVYEHHGELAQPTSRMPPEANPTSRSLETNSRPNWVLIGSVLVATIALILTALFIMLRNPSTTTTPVSPPAVTVPEPPAAQPPQPPSPPQGIPPGSSGSSISRELIYPGAETMMEVTDVSEGAVLQLQTSDSFDKVVAWYTQKLKPTKVVKLPSSNVILEAGETKAIINSRGDQTIILVTQGED